MDKTIALKWINFGLGITLLLQIFSGILIGNIGSDLPNFFFGLHSANGWIVFFFALLHLAYNWNWIKANLPKA